MLVQWRWLIAHGKTSPSKEFKKRGFGPMCRGVLLNLALVLDNFAVLQLSKQPHQSTKGF